MAEDGQQPKTEPLKPPISAEPPRQWPMAVSDYFPLLDDKPVTPAQAQALFDQLSARPDISFGYAGDGCFARAHLMCENLVGDGHTPGKAWAFRSPDGPLVVNALSGNEIIWRYHVAPNLPVQMPDGRIERMVIDPSLFDGPVTKNRWGEVMGAKPSQLFETPLNVAPAGWGGDYNPAQITTPATTTDAHGYMKQFMPLQEQRRVFACDLGACTAGEISAGKPLVEGRPVLPHYDTVTLEMPIPTVESVRPVVAQHDPKLFASGAGAALGFGMGVMGLENAIQNKDAIGGAIASTNIVTSTVEGAEAIALTAGRSIPALKSVSRYVPGANVAVTVADGFYQVMKEDTPQHRDERLYAVGATTATALTLGTTVATVGEAAAITTGVTAVAGTGAVGTGAAAVAVAYTGDKVIEAKRAWDDVDRQIAENGAPQRHNFTPQGSDGSPDLRKFKHIIPEMMEVSRDIRDSELPFKPQRDPRSGRIKIDDMRKLALSKDPKFLAEFERALDTHIARNKKTMEDNDSYLPKWMRFSDGVSKYSMAQMVLADLEGAKTELGWFRNDMAAWNVAHAPAADQQKGGTFFRNNRPQGPGGK